MDGLIPGFRKDKGISRSLSGDAINEIYRLREKFPRINGVMIHQMLIHNGFINTSVSVRAVQRFLKENDLKSARNPMVKDRKAYEMNEYRRNLTASLAHDLKSPLMAISGYAENLRDNIHTEKRAAYADSIIYSESANAALTSSLG